MNDINFITLNSYVTAPHDGLPGKVYVMVGPDGSRAVYATKRITVTDPVDEVAIGHELARMIQKYYEEA